MSNYDLALSSFESIDALDLAKISGGNWVQDLGKGMQGTGEAAAAVGAVGTVIPVVGETGIPEVIAAAGGASWLLGKGVEYIGGLFN